MLPLYIQDQIIEEMKATRREHNVLKEEIDEWMNNNAKKGILCYAGDHPKWPQYEAALGKWQNAVLKFDGMLETNTVS